MAAEQLGLQEHIFALLAAQQREAAEKIGTGTDYTNEMLSEATGLGILLKPLTSLYGVLGDDGPGFWLSHGPACFRSILAIADALEARKETGAKMMEVSEGLDKKLEIAAKAYKGTDDQTGDNLDNQMLSP